MTAFTCTLLLALGAADGGFAFPPDIRAREDALVRSFGLRSPDGGVLPPRAGTATAGRAEYAEYAEPGRLVLPRTRVPFQVALTRRELFPDGRSFDGYGLPPDVLIEDPEGWAPESLRAFARSLLSAPPR